MRLFDDLIFLRRLAHHKNVIRFLGAVVKIGYPLCIITEYLPNGDLASYLKANPYQPEHVLNAFVKGISSGVKYLHTQEIVHRDISARNILLTQDLVPKISDCKILKNHLIIFTVGMSRVLERKESNFTECNIGPLRWMSPELLLYQLYSYKSDAWSFGAVMVEIYTNNVPYPELSPAQVAANGIIFHASMYLLMFS